MPRILQATPPGGERAEITLSERVVAGNLDTAHYRAQLLERLTWATTDAEALESRIRACEPGEDTIPSLSPARANPHAISRIRHAARSVGLRCPRPSAETHFPHLLVQGP